MQWEIVIGLEIHAQLATRSKIFSGASTTYGAAPNSQASLIDLGYPGVLPVLNAEAVTMAVRFGLATNCEIARRSVFARKNYFYPDLPKGYQISQYELPIVHGGKLDIVLEDGSTRTVDIVRAHLEEDAGKSLHEDFAGMSGIDLNRAGTGLLEIVSAPDLRSAAEAGAYMRKIHALVRYLGICDGNMQEGSFRCDANVSVRRRGEAKLGTRTELKNLNSFKFVERAITIEAEQADRAHRGRRQSHPGDAALRSRSRRDAADAQQGGSERLSLLPGSRSRCPSSIDERLIADVRASLPELPDAKRERFMRDYALPAYDAEVLTVERALADYFEAVAKATKATPKIAANWVMGELTGALNRDGVEIGATRVSAATLAALLDKIAAGTISGKIAKEVFEALWRTGKRRRHRRRDHREARAHADLRLVAASTSSSPRSSPRTRRRPSSSARASSRCSASSSARS